MSNIVRPHSSLVPEPQAAAPVNPGVCIGHVHLRVSDIEKGLSFWRDVLGFEVMQRRPGAVFLSAGGYHHHIALNTWDSAGGPPAAKTSPGLYHVAILYPTRAALGAALKRVLEAGIALTGASDHGVSVALYLDDHDGNGVELYWDKPEAEWPRTEDNHLDMGRAKVDLQALLDEAAAG